MKKLITLLALAVLVASVQASVSYTAPTSFSWTLKRGNSKVATGTGAQANCWARAAADAETRTTTAIYNCTFVGSATMNYNAPSTSSCSATQPTTLSRVQNCPSGTTGTWVQTSTYSLQPSPTCWVAGAWTPTVAPSGACVPVAGGSGSVTLAWAPPLTGADSGGVGALSGFRIYYGTASGTYLNSVFVSGASASSGTVTGLAAGTWYFTIVAVDSSGNESSYSYETSKTL